ncbi:MAG TPA: carboxypeptidase-like regulatory domain-containing protein [Polyangia bacterium]
MVGASANAAADPPEGEGLPRARLEMRASGTLHDDKISRGGQRIDTQGSALSRLGFEGAWLASTVPLGIAAHLHVERFGVKGDDPMGGRLDTVATALETSAGVLGRLPGSQMRWGAEGQLGYGFLRLPIAAVSNNAAVAGTSLMSVDMLAVTTHGPQLGARGWLHAGAGITVEGDVRALPYGLSARYADRSVRLWRASAGAGLLFGRFHAAGVSWTPRLGYELAATGASDEAAGLEIDQRQHIVGIGVRAGFLAPPAGAGATTTRRPVVAEKNLRTIHGVVRRSGPAAEGGGTAVAGVEVSVVDGPRLRTDAQGRFVLKDVAPGLVQLRLHRDGFLPAEEVVAVTADGDVNLEAVLRPTAANRIATISGVIRSESGAPVSARVRVLERDEDAQADKDGRFHLDLPAGRYTMVIEAPGFGRQERSVEISAGEQRIYNVDLKAVP